MMQTTQHPVHPAQFPLVSAIITTHNRTTLLARAIESVLAQTYSNLELIIVDDASTDRTSDLVENFQNKSTVEIRYLKHELRLGACAARNAGLKNANGKLVAGLDDDDEWMPERIEELVRSWDPGCAFVFANDYVMRKDNKNYRNHKGNCYSLACILYRNVIGNQVLVERGKIISIGGFDENLEACQDYDMWLRLILEYGKPCKVNHTLQTMYENHLEERISHSPRKFKGYLHFYKKHKHHMNSDQRRYQLFVMYYIRGKTPSLHRLLQLLSYMRFPRQLYYYFTMLRAENG